MTAEARAILGSIAEAPDPREFILQDFIGPELRTQGFKLIGKDSWSKKIRNRGAEGYVSAIKELRHSYRVTLEVRMPSPRPAAQPELQTFFLEYILEIYVLPVVQALIKAFKQVAPIRSFSYHEKNRYFDSMSMMSGATVREALPSGISISDIYYRGGIGETQEDPREFILKQPTKHYRAYLLGAYSQSSPDYGKFVDLEAPTPQEAWDSLQAEGKRLGEIYDADGNCWRAGMDGLLQPKLNAPPPLHPFTEGVRDTPADLRSLAEAVDPKDFILGQNPRYWVTAKTSTGTAYWGGTGQPYFETGVGYWHANPLDAPQFTYDEAKANLDWLTTVYKQQDADPEHLSTLLVDRNLLTSYHKRREAAARRIARRIGKKYVPGPEPVEEAVDPKDFILKNAPRSYTAYFLNWSMKDDTAKVVAPTPAEAFKLANAIEYGRRAAWLVDDETGQRFAQNLWGNIVIKEETVNPRDFILASTPWHDELVAAGFERTKAENTYPFNETWFKTYPFMDGKIVIMAEPHLNVPDEEVLNPTNPIIRLYCEYTNPREGEDYPIQVFQRWVPVPKLKQAMPHVDQAVKTSTSLEQLQKTLEYGFYRLASWWPGPSAVADSLPQFRAALESRGWQFGKLNAIPMVGGGEVQEHVYKKVNKGTVWTLNASLTPQGKLFAFGSGFKVVMENDEPKDVDWPLAEQTQPEGMGVPEFAELVSAATEI